MHFGEQAINVKFDVNNRRLLMEITGRHEFCCAFACPAAFLPASIFKSKRDLDEVGRWVPG
jgi:hypothetical protein